MAQKTALSTIGTPGRIQSFIAKAEASITSLQIFAETFFITQVHTESVFIVQIKSETIFITQIKKENLFI